MKPKWDISCCRLLRPIQNTDPVPPSFSRSFTRGNTKSNQNLKGQYSGQNSPISQHAPPLPSLTNSPSMSSSFGQESGLYNEHEPKRFLNEKYAKCSVKGNFLTLAAQPKNVELGEWLAHQCMSWIPKLPCQPSALTLGSGGDEPPSHRADTGHPRSRYQHWSPTVQRTLLSNNVCWTVGNSSLFHPSFQPLTFGLQSHIHLVGGRPPRQNPRSLIHCSSPAMDCRQDS